MKYLKYLKYLKTSKCLTAAGIMLLLTGCARETDLSARFPDYLQYSLGADYKTELLTDGGGKNADKWQFYYHDHTGASREIKGGFSIFPYDMRNNSLKDWSMEEYYTLKLNQLTALEISRISDAEFTEQIVKKHFSAYSGTMGEDGNLKTATLQFGAMTVMDYQMNADKEDYDLLLKSVQQVCTANLKTVANSPAWYYFLFLNVDEGEDAQPFLTQAKDALSGYQSYAGTAQNYDFCVRQKKNGKTETLWEEAIIHGEPADPRHYNNDVAEAYREQMKGKE